MHFLKIKYHSLCFGTFVLKCNSVINHFNICKLHNIAISPVLLRETNLKVKQALTVTGEMGNDIERLAAFKGKIKKKHEKK